MHVKRIGLIISVVVLSTLVWWAAHEWLTQPGRFSDFSTWLVPGIAVIVMGAGVLLAFVLIENRSEWLAATLASWASLILFWRPDIWYLTVLPFFLFFWHEAWRRVRADMSDRRKIRINATLGSGMKMVLLGAFLMMSMGFYLLPSTRAINIGSVSKDVQQQVDTSYENPIVQSQLAAEQFPDEFHQKVKEDLLVRVDSMVRDWLGPLSPYLPPILAFVLFLSLWSVAFIMREFAIWLGVLLFWLLKATGFVRIETEQVPHEVLRL
jgi:hypothetical protein